jgi:hypothetical protein
VSNQTQAPAPAVPQTIHIWMFATAAISTILVIPHAIAAATWHWPPTIANLHYIITLGFWIAGVAFVTRSPNSTAIDESKMSEVDKLEMWLRLTDD